LPAIQTLGGNSNAILAQNKHTVPEEGDMTISFEKKFESAPKPKKILSASVR
jgi:hypothetical protein